jgi:hypothetical protein
LKGREFLAGVSREKSISSTKTMMAILKPMVATMKVMMTIMKLMTATMKLMMTNMSS